MSWLQTHTLLIREDTDSNNSTSGGLSTELITEAEDHWNVSGKSVLIAWTVTTIGAALVLATYSWRRPKDLVIFQPRVGAHSTPKPTDRQNGIYITRAPEAPTSSFGWLTSALKDAWLEFKTIFRQTETRDKLRSRDFELMSTIGMDAMTFIQFCRLLRWLFLSITICVAIPLTIIMYNINSFTPADDPNSTPINPGTAFSGSSANSLNGRSASTPSESSDSTSVVDNVQLLTAANITGDALTWQIFFEFGASALVFLFIWRHIEYHKLLVKEWTKLNCNEIAFKTVLVTNIDMKVLEIEVQAADPSQTKRKRKGRRKLKADTAEGIKAIICAKIGAESLSGRKQYPVTLNHKGMTEIQEKKEDFDEEFEKLDLHVSKILRGELEDHQVHHDSLWDQVTGNGKTLRARCKQLVKDLNHLNDAREKIRERPPHKDLVTSAFVTVSSISQARSIVTNWQAKHEYRPGGLHVERAPRSDNIIWNNLEKSGSERRTHEVVGTVILVFFCCLSAPPVVVMVFLSNLESVVPDIAWLNNLQKSSTVGSAAISAAAGLLPAAISAMFSFLLPIVMRHLGKFSGAYHRGQLDKDVTKQLFMFLLVSQLIFLSLIGILYDGYLIIRDQIGKEDWWTILEALGHQYTRIPTAYITESSYWLSWFPLRSLLVCVHLLQVPRMFLKLIGFFALKTGNNLHDWSKPRTFEYSIEYAHLLFAMTVGIIYTPLAPLVTICSAIYFWASSIVYTNNLCFVEDTKESDGKVWQIAINRLLLSVVFMQLLMCLTIGLKTSGSIGMTLTTTIPLIFTLLLKYHLHRVLRHESTSPQSSENSLEAGENGVATKRSRKPPEKYEHQLLKNEMTFRYPRQQANELRRLHERIPELRFLIAIPDAPDREDEKKITR